MIQYVYVQTLLVISDLLSMCAHLADEVWSHVRHVTELSAHLQVVDAADGIPELCQRVGAHHQHGDVGSDIAKLTGGYSEYVSIVETYN